MQFTVDRSALARELALVTPVAEKKTTIPILSHVRIEAGDGALKLTATNLEQGLTVSVPSEVKDPGVICLPAARLLKLVQSLPGDIAIKTSENQYATITSGRSRTRIAGMSSESFPELPASPESSVNLDARLFARNLARVAFAISMEESRFTTNGALVEFPGALMRAVATDGHRLAFAEVPGVEGAAGGKFLMPKAAIGFYSKLADMAEGGARVEVATDDNHLYFTVGGRRLLSRRLVGNFPDYSRVLPTHETSINVDRAEFLAAVERVFQFSDERSHAIRLMFAAGEIRILASSVEVGESEESISCDGAAEMEVGFNAQYLVDGLKAITHPRAALFVKDAKSAGELRAMAGAGTEQDPFKVGADYRYVVMPMRI